MDLRLNLYFREIVYHNPSAKKTSVCGAFSYEALNVEEAKLGNLYLVGKISNFPPKKYKNFDFLINLLGSAIKREFYSHPQRTTLDALESALQSANIYLADFAKKGHKEWINNLDFACIAFSKNAIHTGQTGNMLIYLFRGNAITNIARKFSKKEKIQPSKTFTNIASGKLEENDKIIISTFDILDIVPGPKIKKLISYSSTEYLYNFLKEKLETKNNKISSLACLLLEVRSKPLVIEKEITVKKEPKIIGLDLERILNSQSNKLTNIVKTKISPSFKYHELLISLVRHHLPKYLLTFFIFLLIILSPYISQKINYDSKIKQIDNLIKRITETTNKSELSLTFQNQTQAQALLQQANALIATAKSLLKQLPERVKQASIENLRLIQEGLDVQINSINNVVNISQPEEIADLLKNTYTFNPVGILKVENYLFLYEITSGFIYKIDLDDLNNPTLIFLSSKDTFKLGAVKENAVILLSDPEKIYVYSKNDLYNTYLLKPNLENTLYIKDMTNYNDNLYFLNTEKLDILKYIPQENSLSGSSWLNDPPAGGKEDLIDAQSIAVDGSVFVSKTDGRIIEFVQGKKVREFKPNVSPEFNKGHQIFTQPDMKNLYLLDPVNSRIISINKKDSFTIQYISDYFDSLIDFWVSADEKTIYILNGLKVYRINI